MRTTEQLELAFAPALGLRAAATIQEELRAFRDFGQSTRTFRLEAAAGRPPSSVEVFVNEFWTARQRAAHSLHEISYRACFKPQLPRFFIRRFTRPGEVVYDPFMGRGTTLLEAALLGRIPWGCDANPLGAILITPRLSPPTLGEVRGRLAGIDFSLPTEPPEELLVFYHPETLREICALRHYLLARQAEGRLDPVDAWIRMVALNRLTGHSVGFFSVYTLPPNQAVSVKSQKRINQQRHQVPPRRHVPRLILAKTEDLLKDCAEAEGRALTELSRRAVVLAQSSDSTPEIPDRSVALVVTSPPFLNVVDYATDNWLRCWFAGVEAASVRLSVSSSLAAWQAAMTRVFRELHRVLRPGGHVAFEVGEIRKGQTRLEEAALPCGLAAGLEPVLVLINDQQFTKTANCWGVSNNAKGTNTNRIVLFRRPG